MEMISFNGRLCSFGKSSGCAYDAELETFELLTRAVRERRAVRLVYRKHGEVNKLQKHVHPCHIPTLPLYRLSVLSFFPLSNFQISAFTFP